MWVYYLKSTTSSGFKERNILGNYSEWQKTEFDIQLETQKSLPSTLQMVGLIKLEQSCSASGGCWDATDHYSPKIHSYSHTGVTMETALHRGPPSSERSVLHHSSQCASVQILCWAGDGALSYDLFHSIGCYTPWYIDAAATVLPKHQSSQFQLLTSVDHSKLSQWLRSLRLRHDAHVKSNTERCWVDSYTPDFHVFTCSDVSEWLQWPTLQKHQWRSTQSAWTDTSGSVWNASATDFKTPYWNISNVHAMMVKQAHFVNS